MSDREIKQLCLSLMRADTEEEVIALLSDAGYWGDPTCWRYYGDYENNYNTIGNQQSRPDAALVEKLVNSVDARLMSECLVRGADPGGPTAPQSIYEAVARFFEGSDRPDNSNAGRIRNWTNAERTDVARGITLVATGATAQQGNPSFTVSDCGEGQTPDMMPNTLLSLNKSNKLRIPFVQGKFNMGGTGVLKFCGRHNLQLMVSRRNPKILNGNLLDPSDAKWGFAIVRREDPDAGRRSSVYTYLAPVEAADRPGRGGVLRFSSDTMPIFPEGRDPYARPAEWGTLVKIYEYEATGYKSHILRKDGLLSRLDALLANPALPVRLYECRPGYRGHPGSFETTMTGVAVRLDDDRAENLESGFPSSCPMTIGGEQMTATIYAFKKGRAEAYRKNEGVIFTVNGQTHGHFTQDLFRRKTVGLSYLADSLLVIVDCTNLTGRAREDLFMNSRDRLSGGALRADIEAALEELLKHHDGLRALRERRRREEIEARLDDSKPLEAVLESLLDRYPALSALFLPGQRLSRAFKKKTVGHNGREFQGKRYPTYFRFKGKQVGAVLARECCINMRSRITFETDAANDYFSREVDRGEFSLSMVQSGLRAPASNFVLNLQNGSAVLSLPLPPNCRIGDRLEFLSTVIDPSRTHPFENRFVLTVGGPQESPGRPSRKRKAGSGGRGNSQEQGSGIALPKVIPVHESQWAEQEPPFDEYTALRIKNAGNGSDNGSDVDGPAVYDFFVNVDNAYLRTELKSASQDPEIVRARFTHGLVLLGLGILHDDAHCASARHRNEDADVREDRQANVEDQVETLTRAVAPVLLPMIDALGALDIDSARAMDGSGEAT